MKSYAGWCIRYGSITTPTLALFPANVKEELATRSQVSLIHVLPSAGRSSLVRTLLVIVSRISIAFNLSSNA